MKNIITAIVALFLLCFSLNAKTTQWTTFDLKDGLIIFKVKIKDQEVKAMLRTGAQRSIIDKEVAKKITLRSRNKTAHKVYIEYEGIKTKLSPLRIFDFENKDKTRFDMILGADYLKKMESVNIDYRNKKISFGNLDLKNKKKYEIPLHVSSKKIYTKALANKHKKIRLIIDTGNSSSIFLKYKTAKKLGLRKNEKLKTKGTGIAKEFFAYGGKLKSLKIGDLKLKDVNVHFPDKVKDFKFNKSSYDGLLGYEILKDYAVTINMKKKVMYLLKHKKIKTKKPIKKPVLTPNK